MIEQCFGGIDVSQDRLDVLLLPQGTGFSVDNDEAGWSRHSCSFDHLISAGEERGRDRETEGFGGFQVDYQFKFGWLLNRKVLGLRTLQDFVHIGSGAAVKITTVGSEAQEATFLGLLSAGEQRRKLELQSKVGQPYALALNSGVARTTTAPAPTRRISENALPNSAALLAGTG